MKDMFYSIVLGMVALCMAATIARADESTTRPATNPAGILAAGALINIRITDLTGPGVTSEWPVRLDKDGNVSVPLIGELPLGGLSNDVAAVQIAEAFADARLIKQALVMVDILEPADQASVKPGPFAAGDTAEIRIVDLEGPGKITVVHAVVAADGTVQVPVAGALQLGGLSESKADAALQKLYRDKGAINHATVSVLRTAPVK